MVNRAVALIIRKTSQLWWFNWLNYGTEILPLAAPRVLSLEPLYIFTKQHKLSFFRHDLSDNQLECLVIEITRPHSRPFLVSTWYRPPNSLKDIFSRFEILVDKIDSENNDLYLLGDLNCDMLHNRSNYHISGAPNDNIVQNHLNIGLLNVL